MLNAYLTQTTRLLQNPPAASSLYTNADLTSYINTARDQVAGEAACIRVLATQATTQGVQTYPFSSIVLPAAATTAGVGGVFNVREITINVVGGIKYVQGWPWEWFLRYYVAVMSTGQGTPANWAQYAQGVLGSFAIAPIPDAGPGPNYTMTLDCACFPIPLVNDNTPEAIPYPWTDAVPFYAAYYAYMSSQRQADADGMFKRYEEFAVRARAISTPPVLPNNYEQSARTPISGGR